MKKIVVVVKKEFFDRYTGKKCKPGDKLTVTDARFREIKRSGDFAEYDKKATELMLDAAKKAASNSEK